MSIILHENPLAQGMKNHDLSHMILARFHYYEGATTLTNSWNSKD